MNCTEARFFLYAYLDRDISASEADALSRHLAECGSCEVRARSARGLVKVLRSHLDRATAPPRLRNRLHHGAAPAVRHRAPVFAMAAAVVLLVLPLVAHDPGRSAAPASAIALASAGLASSSAGLAASATASGSRKVTLTGTLVCLQCDTRHEAGLHALPEPGHATGFCAQDGQVWRLMERNPSFAQAAVGQTVTVEGIEFPQSGFLRASRVGY